VNETYKLRTIGGALVVTIPRHIQRLVCIKAGDDVRFTVSASRRKGVTGLIIIEPQPRKNGVKK
jgi:antitoxin component of MazEF toxin-antitoxin module